MKTGLPTATTAAPAAGPALRRGLLIAFTLPTLVLGIMHGPEGQVQAIYAKHAGVSLTALAAAMLLSRILDGITYPLIGWLSDRSYARRGTRKGWIVAGTIISVVGMWGLLRPPAGVGAVYFAVWMTVTYVGWKIMEIPLQAWSYGLSEDYVQRNRVQAWRGLSQLLGALLFFIIPFLALQIGWSDSTELDFRSLGLTAIICAVALPLAALAAIAFVPDGAGPPPPPPKRPSFANVWGAIRVNAPLLHLLAAFAPVSLLTGLMNGVMYLYIDAYLGLSQQFAAVMVLALLASVFGIPVWAALAARYERHRVWAAALIMGGVACALSATATPGPAALPLMLVAYPLVSFSIAGAVIVYAMSADIVDYGKLLTREDHAGLYGSIFYFVQKSLLGVSGAAGLAIAGFSGFDATAETQTAGAVLGLKLAGAVLPALGLLGAAAIIWKYPLTRARVAEVQAQLHSEKQGEPPAQPST